MKRLCLAACLLVSLLLGMVSVPAAHAGPGESCASFGGRVVKTKQPTTLFPVKLVIRAKKNKACGYATTTNGFRAHLTFTTKVTRVWFEDMECQSRHDRTVKSWTAERAALRIDRLRVKEQMFTVKASDGNGNVRKLSWNARISSASIC